MSIVPRFPDDIAYGSAGGPVFSTSITTNAAGFERRSSNWAQARAVYNVAHGVKTKQQLDVLIAFFRARRGRAEPFRFRDWSDYTIIAQSLGTGDGSAASFQLVKDYSDGAQVHQRVITRPVASSIRVYVNDVLLDAADVSVNEATGIITLAISPASGASVVVDAEFDVLVRFETDQLVARLDDAGVYSWGDIALVEVRDGAEG